MSDPRLSDFARMKGQRLTEAVREALHPIVNDKGLVAVRVVLLYEADGQMLGGALDIQTHPGAGAFLDELLRQRVAGELSTAHKGTRSHLQMRKS